MSAASSIEERLTLLEEKVKELQQQMPGVRSAPDWFRRVAGSFKDDPEFDEILWLGREIREADQVADPSEKP